MDTFWSSLVGSGVGGAVASGLVTVALHFLTRNADREKWIRDRKQVAYSECLDEFTDFQHRLARFVNEGLPVESVLSTGSVARNNGLLLLAPTKVRLAQVQVGMALNRCRKHLAEHPNATGDDPWLNRFAYELQVARDEFLNAAQEDLGIKPSEGHSILLTEGEAP